MPHNMDRIYFFCVMCCAFFAWCSAAPKDRTGIQPDNKVEQNDILQEEIDGHGNILSQLLGDYDKVKALSEGSDCRCKCVVRPLSRSACRRIEEGSATGQDFYTVETITSGPECKCACIAPPSAVNPCEGEFRLKKLREAGKENVKLSSILELLEGSFYGMDLLKLHSVTAKLLDRVEHIEKAVSVNHTKYEARPHRGPRVQPHVTESPPTSPLHLRLEKRKRLSELSDTAAAYQPLEERYEEKFVGGHESSLKRDAPVQTSQVTAHGTTQEVTEQEASQVVKTGLSGMVIRGMTFYKSENEPMVADDGEPGENFFEYHGFSGDGPINLFIEEQLLQHKAPPPRPRVRAGQTSRAAVGPVGGAKEASQPTKPNQTEPDPTKHGVSTDVMTTPSEGVTTPSTMRAITERPSTTMQATRNTDTSSATTQITDRIITRTTKWPILMMVKPISTSPRLTTVKPVETTTTQKPATNETLTLFTSTNKPIIVMDTSTAESPMAMEVKDNTQTIVGTTTSSTQGENLTMEASATTTIAPTTIAKNAATSSAPEIPSTTISIEAITTAKTTTTTTTKTAPVKRKYSISWEEEEEGPQGPEGTIQNFGDASPRKPEECKDTLATISEPVTHNTYGRKEGAWMKDPKASDDKIYVTNYYYGNNLLEFRNMEVFKQGRFTNSYKLPYNWIGTGHVVYDGAFYYNRAFSRDIIKFDLRSRNVAAWTMLHDVVFEETSSPWQWQGHSGIDFAVDESGLWVIYPALDDEGFLQEVIALTRLNPSDLSMQRETTWRTGLRRNHYGNCFIVCGVLYAVDSYNRRDANLAYAYDTHTNSQTFPRMPLTNNYTYTTQIDYNPKEGLLYAWDNGHQVTYNIKFAYVDPL